MAVTGTHSFEARHVHSNQVYRLSIEREHEFVQWLGKTLPNHEVAFSTARQNIEQDIDVIIDRTRTISFKHCAKCLKTGNLAFEIEAYSRKSIRWVDGWWRAGRAEYYVFEVASDYWLIDCIDIHNYVRDNGFDAIKTLGRERSEANKAMGHDHLDAKSGLLKLETLIYLKLARKIGTRGVYDRSERILENVLHIKPYHGRYASADCDDD